MPISRYRSSIRAGKPDMILGAQRIENREGDEVIEYSEANRLDVLSYTYYSTPVFWWVILAANPAYADEFEIQPGDLIRVPIPVESAIKDLSL